MPAYLRFFTFLGHDEIGELDEVTQANPERRVAQRVLARDVTARVHGDDEARRVERAAEALYTEDVAALDETTLLEVFADSPSSTRPRSEIDGVGLDPVDVFAESGLVASKSQARATLEQGGAYLNNRRLEPGEKITVDRLIAGRYLVLRRGRRELHLLRFE